VNISEPENKNYSDYDLIDRFDLPFPNVPKLRIKKNEINEYYCEISKKCFQQYLKKKVNLFKLINFLRFK